MKRTIFILFAMLILFTSIPASAQDEMNFCNVDDFMAGFTDFADSLDASLLLLDVGDEPSIDELMNLVVTLDANNHAYWADFLDSRNNGHCFEIDWFGYRGGLLLDEMLMTAQLAALSVHADAAGISEMQEMYADLTDARANSLGESVNEFSTTLNQAVSGMGGVDNVLPACSQEEMDATIEGLDQISAAYNDIGTITPETSGDELAIMTASYANLSAGFWADFAPVVPTCQQARDATRLAGLIIDESFLIAASLQLSELASDEETAATLRESALARLENLNAELEAMGMQ